MAEETKRKTLAEEAGLPDNWVSVDTEPIRPGVSAGGATAGAPIQPQGFRSTNDVPPYFSGSISPDMAHDANFVRSQMASPAVPTAQLMPVAPSGNPQTNAAIQSIVKSSSTAAVAAPSSGLNFRGVWLSFVKYNIGDVVLFNKSTYIAITTSLGTQPDLSTTNWTLLSENLVFNPTISETMGGEGLGPFDKSASTSGSSSTFSSGSLSPSFSNELAIWFGAYGTGGSPEGALPISELSAAGWSLLGLPPASLGALINLRPNTNSFSAGALLGGSVPWASLMTLWTFGGSLTATVTAVTVDGSDQVTVLCNNTFKAGQHASFSGLTSATFLNGQTVKITSATSTQIVFTFSHAAYGPTSDTGTALLNPYVQQGFSQSGSFSPPYSIPFANPVTAGNTIVVIVISNAGAGGAAGITSVTDSSGNIYHVLSATTGTGGFNGIQVSIAYAQNVAAGTPTVTINGNGGSGATIAAYELSGGGGLPIYHYVPYDVLEFRGSIWVCLAETTDDPYTNPANWGLMAQGTGTVDVETSGYLATATDSGRLISFNSSSPVTLTLPNPAPELTAPESSGWWISVENTGTGALTIDPNGLLIDGSGSSLVLQQNQGVAIFTDGSNYYTVRGIGGVTSINGLTGVVDITAGTGISVSVVGQDIEISSTSAEFTNQNAKTALMGPVACSSPALPTFRQPQGTDLLNLNISSAFAVNATTDQSGNLRLCGAALPAGLYRVSVYVVVTTGGAGNLSMTITWDDGTASQSYSPSNISTVSPGTLAQFDIPVLSDGVHDIAFAFALI